MRGSRSGDVIIGKMTMLRRKVDKVCERNFDKIEPYNFVDMKENKDRECTHLELGTIPSELCMAQSHVASKQNNKENEEMHQVNQANDDRLD